MRRSNLVVQELVSHWKKEATQSRKIATPSARNDKKLIVVAEFIFASGLGDEPRHYENVSLRY